MPRIVSLIASATEIVCELGFHDHLVGRSHECDFPESIRELPVCTEPKFNVEGSSREIDQRVKQTLQEATSVYTVHEDVLEKLQPEVILTQAQCEVCAVSLKDVEKALSSWLESQPKVVSLEPNCLADVWSDIDKVASALDAFEQGDFLLDRLQLRMQVVSGKVSWISHRPSVACLEWLDPLMAAGNWIPELVTMAGGINWFGEAGTHSPWMTWEELLQKDPEIIVALPCGFDLQRTRKEMSALSARPEWTQLQAVQNNRVFVTDGNQYFNRPGPRLVESLEILAEIFYPEAFFFNHEGSGWERYR